MVVVFVHAVFAQPGSAPAYFPYPPGVIPADLDQEVQRVQGEVDQIFQQALAQWRALPINPSTRMPQVQLLGKLLLFDKNLSVNRNQACSFCHMPYTAFTGPISSLNATTVAYPGSVPWRFGHRKPQSYTYAPLYPGLQYHSDKGVGDFLRGPLNPNAGWTQYADRFDGKMQTPTLRNVDLRPYPEFVKAYMYNGYFKSLQEVVHFYNTRDTPEPCGLEKIEKVTCWPPPEVPQNVTKTIGNLGLSAAEEDQLVAFLKTLTDGYTPPAAKSIR